MNSALIVVTASQPTNSGIDLSEPQIKASTNQPTKQPFYQHTDQRLEDRRIESSELISESINRLDNRSIDGRTVHHDVPTYFAFLSTTTGGSFARIRASTAAKSHMCHLPGRVSCALQVSALFRLIFRFIHFTLWLCIYIYIYIEPTASCELNVVQRSRQNVTEPLRLARSIVV